jgi:RNA-binding protein 5/10
VWPPPFDEDGDRYVLDARSGYFYEAGSRFFYEPRTRLYYSTEAGSYFRHCRGEDPPFQPVEANPQREQEQQEKEEKEEEEEEEEEEAEAAKSRAGLEGAAGRTPDGRRGAPSAHSGGGGSGSAGGKRRIAISLRARVGGGAALPPPPPASEVAARELAAATAAASRERPPPAPEPRASRTREADLAKWSERQREHEGPPAGGGAQGGARAGAGDNGAAGPRQEAAPPTTKRGEPICSLCRRKFSTLQKLRQHEERSDLHRQNLAKREAAEGGAAKKVAPASLSSEYRDRARDRRTMYGPEFSSNPATHTGGTANKPVNIGPSLERAREIAVTEAVRPDDAFGDSNVGNKMLQKLGWKSGASLGRKQNNPGSSEPAALDGGRAEGAARLVQDWERIEQVASIEGRRNHKQGVGSNARKS